MLYGQTRPRAGFVHLRVRETEPGSRGVVHDLRCRLRLRAWQSAQHHRERPFGEPGCFACLVSFCSSVHGLLWLFTTPTSWKAYRRIIRVGEKFLDWPDEPLPLNDILESVSLYWLTESFPRCIYHYREVCRSLFLGVAPSLRSFLCSNTARSKSPCLNFSSPRTLGGTSRNRLGSLTSLKS